MMAYIKGTIKNVDSISGSVKSARDYNLCSNKPRINGVELNGDIPLASIVQDFTGTLSTSGWSDTAPYVQEIAIDGITVDMSPIVDIVLSDDINTAKAEASAWGCVTKAVTGAGCIVFMCYEKIPAVDISVMVKVV